MGPGGRGGSQRIMMRRTRPRFLVAALAILIMMASPTPTGAFFSPRLSMRPPPPLNFIPSHSRRRLSSATSTSTTSTHSLSLAAMPASEQERLLLTEPAQTAFIVAEMRSFLSSTLKRNDSPSGHLTRWEMSTGDKIAANLTEYIDGNVVNVNYKEYQEAKQAMNSHSHTAIDLLCNTTAFTFNDGFTNQPGLLSALGSAICYFRDAFRTPANLAACERVGLSDYDVAHHITDMYHHRNFRGAYTKTLTPSGSGDIAARIAVGIISEEGAEGNSNKGGSENNNNLSEAKDDIGDDGDECILWSPTTEGVCVHWKSDDEAWRKKRFERIQMEGTKDPRRGGSGTMR